MCAQITAPAHSHCSEHCYCIAIYKTALLECRYKAQCCAHCAQCCHRERNQFRTGKTEQPLKNYINSVFLNRIPVLHNIAADRRLLKRLKNEVQNKRVVLWGASLYLHKLIKYHNLNSPEIVGIIDRDPNKSGKKMGKYQIFHPNSLKSLNPDEIISSVVNHPKMKEFIGEELERQQLDIKVNALIFTK